MLLSAHVGLATRPDDRADRVEGRRARDEERVPVLAAPGEVARVLGDLDRSEMLAGRGDDPDPARPRHPDVPALVALHPVRDSLLDDPRADAREEPPFVRERAVVLDVVDVDERS